MLDAVQSVIVAVASTSCLLMAIVVRRSIASVEMRVTRIDSLLARIEERSR